MTTFVVVAFIAVSLSNGALIDLNTDDSPDTTLIQRPVIPGEKGTDSTFGGTTARCKDGTYSFRSGGDDVSDEELCKDNGGVEQKLPPP